jgi:predicted DNA-binding protein YlxM (UPF0122 family)
MNRKITDSQIERIYELFRNDINITEIAKDVGISRTAVYNWLNKNFDFSFRLTDKQVDIIFEQHFKGFSNKIIAESIGCSESTVQKTLVKRAVEIIKPNSQIISNSI